MKKLILLILTLFSFCLIANEKMHKDDKGRWVNSKGGNIYGDSRFNLDADPKFNMDADPKWSIDGDKRYQ